MKRKTHIYFLFFCFILTGNQSLATEYYFKGTIDQFPIYLSLQLDEGTGNGYYFYKKSLHDIPLIAMTNNKVLIVKTDYSIERSPEEDEYFELVLNGKSATGTWKQGNTIRKVALYPIPENELKSSKITTNPFIRDANYRVLDKVKIGLFRLDAADSMLLPNGIKIRNFIEKNTGISFFRIDSGWNKQSVQLANQFLESFHVSQFLANYDCSEFRNSSEDYSFEAHDVHVNSEFVSFEVWITYSCGRSHPNEENFGVNFDLKKGQLIDHEQLFSSSVLNEEDTLFETTVYTYLVRSNPNEMIEQSPEGNDDSYLEQECRYYRKDLWNAHCSFVLKPEGIHLLPYFPHAEAFCYGTEWSVIPYSEMKELIKQQYLDRLTKMKP
jgi:hypothetical protein